MAGVELQLTVRPTAQSARKISEDLEPVTSDLDDVFAPSAASTTPPTRSKSRPYDSVFDAPDPNELVDQWAERYGEDAVGWLRSIVKPVDPLDDLAADFFDKT